MEGGTCLRRPCEGGRRADPKEEKIRKDTNRYRVGKVRWKRSSHVDGRRGMWEYDWDAYMIQLCWFRRVHLRHCTKENTLASGITRVETGKGNGGAGGLLLTWGIV